LLAFTLFREADDQTSTRRVPIRSITTSAIKNKAAPLTQTHGALYQVLSAVTIPENPSALFSAIAITPEEQHTTKISILLNHTFRIQMILR